MMVHVCCIYYFTRCNDVVKRAKSYIMTWSVMVRESTNTNVWSQNLILSLFCIFGNLISLIHSLLKLD
jgi:hypothetical protein